MKKEKHVEETEQSVDDTLTSKEEVRDEQEKNNEIENLKNQLEQVNNSYLLLLADFENYKKKTLKEKSDLLKYGGENVLGNILPIIDDFERAMQALQTEPDSAVKQGIELIYSKFIAFLHQNGVKEIDTKEKPFDTDYHEAITLFPAQQPEDKGKIVDCVQKGYQLHDKVIRFAKVVVAE
jgi:molecular chaperone GrpE